MEANTKDSVLPRSFDMRGRAARYGAALLRLCVIAGSFVLPIEVQAAVTEGHDPPEILAIIPHPVPDLLGPTIREAARRFRVPELWIREVILRESSGMVAAVSPAGAVGPMQVLPATYDRLRQVHGLGPNPQSIRDNILAGAAFLRELHDRFGFPGFLAAYNAGPNRMQRFLEGRSPLPAESVRYVEGLAVRLHGTATPSGALAIFVPGWSEGQKLPQVISAGPANR